MPRLLTPDVTAALAHRLEHVAVANLRADHLDSSFGEPSFEAEVGHHRGDESAVQFTAALMIERDQRHQLITVGNPAFLIDDDDPVGVAVERQANVGAACDHCLLECLRVS